MCNNTCKKIGKLKLKEETFGGSPSLKLGPLMSTPP
jgi:hypothetical protein